MSDGYYSTYYQYRYHCDYCKFRSHDYWEAVDHEEEAKHEEAEAAV